jgi:ornithine carbamoyltransferase
MKMSRFLAGLLLACCLAPMAFAQPKLEVSASEQYLPRLGDIMNAVQIRHIKLSLAGKALNWELAAYELRQLKAGVLEAAVMYPGIPVTNVTTMTAPVQAIADAIAARDSERFVKASGELRAGCNSCHQSMERGFIAIQAPTAAPYGDQSFAPRGK